MESNRVAAHRAIVCACLLLLAPLSACESLGFIFTPIDPIDELNTEAIDTSTDSILVGRIEGYGRPFVDFYVRSNGTYHFSGRIPHVKGTRLLPEGFTHTKGYTRGGFFIKALDPGEYVLYVCGDYDAKDLLYFSIPEGTLFNMGTVSVVMDNYTAFNIYFHAQQRTDEQPLAVFRELYPELYDAYEHRLVEY